MRSYKEFIYTFNDLCQIVNNGEDDNIHALMGDNFNLWTSLLVPNWVTISQKYNFKVQNDGTLNNLSKLLFNELSFKYGDCACVRTFSEDWDELKVQMKNFFFRLLQIWSETYDKYSIILTFYENEQNNLLKSLEHNMEERGNGSSDAIQTFNDTPEDDDATQWIEESVSVSNVTKNKNKANNYVNRKETSDRDYLIDKLDAIQQKYMLVIRRWLEEFSNCFWYISNYEGDE